VQVVVAGGLAVDDQAPVRSGNGKRGVGGAFDVARARPRGFTPARRPRAGRPVTGASSAAGRIGVHLKDGGGGAGSPPCLPATDPPRQGGSVARGVAPRPAQASAWSASTTPSTSAASHCPGSITTPPNATGTSRSPCPSLSVLRGQVPNALIPSPSPASAAASRTAPCTSTPLQPPASACSASMSPSIARRSE